MPVATGRIACCDFGRRRAPVDAAWQHRRAVRPGGFAVPGNAAV